MKPRITVITLGVDDLDRGLTFYRDGLGLPMPWIIGREWEHGAVVFIDLQPGPMLSLWPRPSFAHDSGLPVSQQSPTEFSLGPNVRSEQEVDTVMSQAQPAGAAVIKHARKRFGAAIRAILQIPTAMCGRLSTIPACFPMTKLDL